MPEQPVVSVLRDYDWKAKVALASDSAGSLQSPILQLILHKKDSSEPIVLEFSPSELDDLIGKLEKCRTEISQS